MPSRDIPEYAKRLVRQRCGFGCIFCGAPIYDYDHIQEFAQTGNHDPSNLTLLCPNHHREKTAGRLARESVIEQNTRPFNKRNPLSVMHNLHFKGRYIRMFMGGSLFLAHLRGPEKRFDAIIVNGKPLLSFFADDGRLLLSLRAFDLQGQIVAEVNRSELRHTLQKWDVTFSGPRLAIYEAQREISFELILHPPDGLEVRRANFTADGRSMHVHPNLVIDDNRNFISKCVAGNYDAGVVAGPLPSGFQGSVAFRFA